MFYLAYSIAVPSANIGAGSDEKGPVKKSPLASVCRELLELQTSINNETRKLNQIIADKMPISKDAAAKLAARQGEIVRKLDQLVTKLEKDDAASAFPEAFRLLRDDCKVIESRLTKSDLGKETQAAQTDVAECLKEMIDALKIKRIQEEAALPVSEKKKSVEFVKLTGKEESILRATVYKETLSLRTEMLPKGGTVRVVVVPKELIELHKKKRQAVLVLLMEIAKGARPRDAITAAGYFSALEDGPAVAEFFVFLDETSFDSDDGNATRRHSIIQSLQSTLNKIEK